LVLVFGLFAVVHAQEFFGGHALARARGTVTYAEYLHAGFEELLCATILAVLTVLVGHVLLRDRGFFHRSVDAPASIPGGRSLAILEVVLLALVGVALASCWQRSSVYEVAYGYTYFRLAVRFIEVAVAVLVALTIVKAVARSWRGFRTAMAMAYFATLLAAAGFNADRYIARENVARAAAAKDGTGSPFAYKPLDLDYLEGLSQDAFPVLADTYFDSDPDAAAHLEAAWTRGSSSRGWRSFRGLAGRSRVRRTSTFPASRSRD
jgi:hypothetical protein